MQLLRQITDYDVLGTDPQLLVSVSRYAARGVLLNARQHVAMMHIAKTDLYKLPGGGIEADETTEQALIREIGEETGYHSEIIHDLGYIEEHKHKNRFMQVSYGFIAQAGQASETKLTDHEKRLGMAAEWMTPNQALCALQVGLATTTDYSTSFMLIRDKTILEEAIAWMQRR